MQTIDLEIQAPGKAPTLFEIDEGVYTIGREDDCKIRLNHPEVEGRHAILTVHANGCWVEDLDAERGTLIDGKAVQGRAPLASEQQITIGPFCLQLKKKTRPPEPIIPENAKTPTVPAYTNESAPAPAASADSEPAEKHTATDPQIKLKHSIKQQIHRELVERLDIKRLSTAHIERKELQEKVRATIDRIVHDVRDRLPEQLQPEALAQEVYDEAMGLGPLEEFLADPAITEIMVNGPSRIYVEQQGKLVRTDRTFVDEASVLAVIERIVSPIGRRIDESQPYVDARLSDGSRVNAVIHPLSLVGPCLTIRKFAKVPFTDRDLIRFGTLTETMAAFCSLCVRLRKNIVVSGGTGSGKTSLLNVLSAYLPDTERIVTIEDAAELRLTQDHVLRLEARPPNIEGRGAVTIRDLVRNALRMRPDRIVVGECRGGEALDMLQAMNTGHDGSLTTVHANTPRDVISRLETMVLMSGMELPVRAIREQIASAIDLIVHESRLSDGSRKVVKITEVIGLEGDQITMQDLFEFRQSGLGPEEAVQGRFVPTGAVPTFIEEVKTRGLDFDRSMFDPQRGQHGANTGEAP